MAKAELAYIECPRNGLVPCAVLERFTAAPHVHAVRVKITATRGPFWRGEIMTWTAHQIVPRNRRKGV